MTLLIVEFPEVKRYHLQLFNDKVSNKKINKLILIDEIDFRAISLN
jgi:hypothetical protein